MTDISTIPSEELHRDLVETQVDIRLCRAALVLGIERYCNGKAEVRERLDINVAIEAKIEAELVRRELLIDQVVYEGYVTP